MTSTNSATTNFYTAVRSLTLSRSSNQPEAVAANEDDKMLESFKSGSWETLPAKLDTARTNYGAAVIESEDGSSFVLVAGGEVGNKVLKSIEIFDPNNKKVTLSEHRLNEARFGCGAFAVTKNAMCVLGGMNEKGEYLCTVELVHRTAPSILLPEKFNLPHNMIYFGTAVVSVNGTKKVYIFGGQTDKQNILDSIYVADVSTFVKYLRDQVEPTTDVWKPIGTAAGFVPRFRFALAVTDDVVWLFGGTGSKYRVVDVGQYDTKTTNYTKDKYKNFDRVDSTAVAIGQNIVVLGGVLPSDNEASTSASNILSQRTASKRPPKGTNKALFYSTLKTSHTNGIEQSFSDFYMRGQCVFMVGSTLYAIGQYDFENDKVLPEIKCMELAATHKPSVLLEENITSTFKSTIEDNSVAIVQSAVESLHMDRKPKGKLSEDSTKIQRVLSGQDIKPALVSKNYGSRCTQNYTSKEIGEGRFGSVYIGLDNSLDIPTTFAIKRVKRIEKTGELKIFEKEVKVLKQARHPNIVTLYGYHIDSGSDDGFLVYEYLDGGSLAAKLVNEDSRAELPYLQRLRIMIDVLCALNFLHSGGAGDVIQHRDIKPDNICLTRDNNAKLIDCGLARIESAAIDNKTTTMYGAGTVLYMCKLYYRTMLKHYQSECDIYSFGVVMVELITGTLNGKNAKLRYNDFYSCFINPHSGTVNNDGVAMLQENCDDMITWSNEYDEMRLFELALLCLCDDLDKRPSAHTLFTEISAMFLRDLPTNILSSSGNRACCVCNEKRKLIKCKSELDPHLCIECISKLTRIKSNMEKQEIQCSKCECTFHKEDLYKIVPFAVYDPFVSHGKLLEAIQKVGSDVRSDVKKVIDSQNLEMRALTTLTAKICDSRCPKLVWLIPEDPAVFSKKQSWLSMKKIPVLIYFFCEHTKTPIETPVTACIAPKLLSRIAPALKMALHLLKKFEVLANVPLPIPGAGIAFTTMNIAKIMAEFLDSLLDKARIEMLDSLFLDHLLERRQRINGLKLAQSAYQSLADNICNSGQDAWKKELTPVLNMSDTEPIIWVKRTFVDNSGRIVNVPVN